MDIDVFHNTSEAFDSLNMCTLHYDRQYNWELSIFVSLLRPNWHGAGDSHARSTRGPRAITKVTRLDLCAFTFTFAYLPPEEP